LLEALGQLGLEPEQAQVPVQWGGLKTKVDLICRGRTEGGAAQRVIVELKVGWNREGAYTAACGNMRGEFGHLLDSPRWQHQVQVAVTRALYAAQNNAPEVTACVLLLCKSEGGSRVERYDLHLDLSAQADAFLAAQQARLVAAGAPPPYIVTSN
jgi:hypothetical protein